MHSRNTENEIGDYTDLHGALLITLRPDCWQCPAMRTSGQHRLIDISGRIYTKHTQKGKKAVFYFKRKCYIVMSIFFLLSGQHVIAEHRLSVKAACKSLTCTSN